LETANYERVPGQQLNMRFIHSNVIPRLNCVALREKFSDYVYAVSPSIINTCSNDITIDIS